MTEHSRFPRLLFLNLFELPQPFEYFILVTILATCVSLALNTPYPNNDSDDTNKELNTDVSLCFDRIKGVCFLDVERGVNLNIGPAAITACHLLGISPNRILILAFCLRFPELNSLNV